MLDLRPLAEKLLDYSLALQPGERLLIEAETGSEPLVRVAIEEAYRRGAVPFFDVSDAGLQRTWLLGAERPQMERQVAWDLRRAEAVDAFLIIKAGNNFFEFSDVSPVRLQDWRLEFKRIVDVTLKKKWCYLRFPTPAAAQAAEMSSTAFEEFFYRVSMLDYARMDRAMDPLAALMQQTDRVRILGPSTDLSFSINGIPVVKCAGTLNIPDGEVFTAPVRDSVQGTITFNTKSVLDGTIYERVSLTFDKGRVTHASGNLPEKIERMLDTDEGARYVGEFALGVNPHIERPMLDILYDEKIAGSLHFTPGNAYDDADNGNRSAVHWDLVLIQTPEWGGGEVWFDDVLVRKDGRFVLPEMAGLNPENIV